MADADVIVVGAGLAGLVVTVELAAAGKRVILLDQEGEQSLGGQAFWSFGGLFLVNSPEQRRLGIHDSPECALQDWMRTAAFDRPQDGHGRRWAEAYVHFASGEKRAWLRSLGVRFVPIVGWAERGGADGRGAGNSVPRFHITWGTGPGLITPFERAVREAVRNGQVRLAFRHRVDHLIWSAGAVAGVEGTVLAPDDSPRGFSTSRHPTGTFSLRAGAVIVASGGIGGSPDLIRACWPERLGLPPDHMLRGVPAHVDGRMLDITARAGGALVNMDRMWHYTEGIINFHPIWPAHGVRILPGPSSLWFDALGRRLPPPLFPGVDTLATLAHLRRSGHDHSWFVLNRRIIAREFTLSGSEQNPDLTLRDVRGVLGRVFRGGRPPAPVAAFQRHGIDFVTASTLPDLVARMNALTPDPLLDSIELQRQIKDRDDQTRHATTTDMQLVGIRTARRYLGERLIRVSPPHRVLDPNAGPLIAVRLHILTRKTLGGLHTDASARVLDAEGRPIPGLFAVGEAAGFGGGGIHGYRALEGTFLGGCLLSGRVAARAARHA